MITTIAEFAAVLAAPPPAEWDSAGYTEHVGVAGVWTPAPVWRSWPCGCSLTQGLSWHRCDAHRPQRCLWAGCGRECSHTPGHEVAMATSEAALRTGDEAGAAAALGWHSIEGTRGGYSFAARRCHEVGVSQGRPFAATRMGLRLSGLVLAQRHSEWRISPEEGMAGLCIQALGGRLCRAEKRILTEQEAILVADWLTRIGDTGSRTGAPLRTYRCWESYDRCHWHVGHSWAVAETAPPPPPVRSAGRMVRRETYADGSVVTRDLVRYSDGSTQTFASRFSDGAIELLD